jgi:hypothetical protein
MISSLHLKFGRTPGSAGVNIPVTPITVFVGPNNSGKSRVLWEIGQFCRTGIRDERALIFDKLEFSALPNEEIEQSIDRIKQPPGPNELLQAGNIIIGTRAGRNHLPLDLLRRYMANPGTSPTEFCQWYLKHSTLSLDGPNRIALIAEQQAGDMQMPPQTSFQILFRNDAKRQEVRRVVSEAFGLYFVLDPTGLGRLRIRLSQRPPHDAIEERGLHAEAIGFHADALDIAAASDGVKAFTGIITEVIAGDPHVMLIDEPEAFLHPSLATKLGHELSRAAVATNKRVFVSTHSSAFVMGCIQSGAPVNIIRLTHQSGVGTSRILPSGEILELMRHPLLRSTGILNGLFYEFVVVTESDTDRAFYQEVNERLLQFVPERGIRNCLFLNAQNKQTVQTILRPLRQLGIPAVGIVDVDVLKDGGANWTNLLAAASIPEISRNPLAAMRVAIKDAMDATGLNMKRDGGIAILGQQDREAAENLLHQLGEYGIFVVPGGELESWLKALAIGGHGPSWLIDIFERMGVDPASPEYVRPGADDVWLFMSHIKRWLVDPNRRGIPG